MTVKPLSEEDCWVGEYMTYEIEGRRAYDEDRLKKLFAELKRCVVDKDFHSLDVNGNFIFYRAILKKIEELFGPLVK